MTDLRRKTTLPILAAAFLLGTLFALAVVAGLCALRPEASAGAAPPAGAAPLSNPKRYAAQRTIPAVVSIAVRRTDGKVSSGSGFIIDRRGYIATTKHVINNAQSITVSLANKRLFSAIVRGTDSKTDIAVLKISASNLTAAGWGDSDSMEAGDDVLAVGNPFGCLSHTVTAGIVSATGRDRIGVIPDGGAYAYEDFIQTDAIINPGNSGGPLVNTAGQVIGVNIAIISKTGLSQKVGLAIPSRVASFVVQRLIGEGRVVRGLLGVAILDVDYDLVRSMKLKKMRDLLAKLGLTRPYGAYILESSGKPAIDAGLMPGDVVLEYDGMKVINTNQLRFLVAKTRPGTVVKLTVVRSGKRRIVPVTLGTQPG